MTDNEIIKALECCIDDELFCTEASYPLKVMEIGVNDYIERCCDEAVEEALAEREEQE